MKWYGKYGRKVSGIVIKYGQNGSTPRYSWNIANVGAKHQPINQSWLLSFV